jgi:hypothetical protein
VRDVEGFEQFYAACYQRLVGQVAAITGTWPTRAAQLQPQRVRVPVSALPRRPATDLHPGPAPSEQAARPCRVPRTRPAVLHAEPGQAEGVPGRRGVVATSATSACGCCFARRACPFNAWKQSRDPAFETKKNRILHPHGLMDGTADVLPSDPDVVMCVDEFGPHNLHPPRPAMDDPRQRQATTSPPATRDLHPPARRAAPAGRLRPEPRPGLRAHQAAQAPPGRGLVLGVLDLGEGLLRPRCMLLGRAASP